jgi:putative ABC transport system permease protein
MTITVSALEGLSAYTRETTAKAFGSETFIVARIGSPGQTERKELQDKLARNLPIRKADYRFMQKSADGRVLYAPNSQRQADVSAGSRKLERVSITGTTSALAWIRDLEIEAGRFFQSSEDERAAPVAVIGAEVASALFPMMDAVGREVRIGGRAFRVIGVQSRIGSSAGATLDRYIFIPLGAFERTFGASDSLQVFARPAGAVHVEDAEDRATTSLRARRRLQPGAANNFDIVRPQAARGFVEAISTRAGAAAFPISAMALLAAVVVVANTTLASVTRRTREIGVRRAVGATRRQVLFEVLAESTIVALIGGAAGIGVGALTVRTFSGIAGFTVAVEPSTVMWSVAAAALSGVLAGLYPARRASIIGVVDAIRAE